MSRIVLQTSQIMPLSSQIPNKNVHSNFYSPLLYPSRNPRRSIWVRKSGKSVVINGCSSSALVDGDLAAHFERCFRLSPTDFDTGLHSLSTSASSSSSVMYAPVMKGQYGALGTVTLEKSKLDLSQRQSKSSPELYDKKFVDAVLHEWQKTMLDLPAGLRQAYEMGLVSSAQMVRFLAINARPTTARFISRALPQGLSRQFIGRMIADPAFLHKFLLDQAATIGCSVWWELKNRGERIKQEWDLALINVLTVSACSAVVVWSLAPCRSYGNTFQFDLQNTLQKLPNNIFEKSYALREFDVQKRIHSFFYKAAELCLVGLTAGVAQSALAKLLANKKGGRVSVTIPTVSTNALSYGAFLGLYANLRYQLLCGIDRALFIRFDVIGVALFFSILLRILNVQIGEPSRLAWLGVEADPLFQSDNLLKAYNRPSKDVTGSSSTWFISKNAISSGLGLLGIKQGTTDHSAEEERAPLKARRKRVVRRKVTASSA
ncbi:hypothetical protein NE237_019081 [Protea cynaroides]|uniref:Protein RETICULATA-RELATED 1, chloroplastic-like n=1 Tax=Protea cynaroides TaxID=273540 RepID=A0A9Q0KB46_9MAGN|nr:hypothetical protein NE237_019081 [Protea cynaroides]